MLTGHAISVESANTTALHVAPPDAGRPTIRFKVLVQSTLFWCPYYLYIVKVDFIISGNIHEYNVFINFNTLKRIYRELSHEEP